MTINSEEVVSREFILNNVLYQLVGRHNNGLNFNNIPHKAFVNLVVIYRVFIGEDENQRASYIVRNAQLRNAGISFEELDAAARENTKKKGIMFVPMGAMGYMVTSENPWGASAILFHDYLQQIHNRLGSDFYILPSSVCEIICVPVGELNPVELQVLVKSINESPSVDENTYLSDSIYIYRAVEGKVSIALD